MPVYGNNIIKKTLNEEYGYEQDGYDTGYSIEGCKIIITNGFIRKTEEEINKLMIHLKEDYKTANSNYKKCLIENFLPWLSKTITKTNYSQYLKLDEISYTYSRIVDKYSPTGKTDYFSQFIFQFIPKNEKAKKIFDCVAMEIIVKNEKVVKCNHWDV